jgi:hypothetical protein
MGSKLHCIVMYCIDFSYAIGFADRSPKYTNLYFAE